ARRSTNCDLRASESERERARTYAGAQIEPEPVREGAPHAGSSGRLDQSPVDDEFAPVTFAVRSEARSTTSVATSSGVVNRPVAKPPMLATAFLRAVSASTPVALATVSATPPLPSHRSVLTGPDDTAFTWMPCDPNSCASDLVRFTTAALAAP